MQTNDHFIQVHAVRRRRGTRRRAATTPTPQRPIMEMQLNQEEFPSRLMDPGLMIGNDPNTRTTGDSSGMCRNKKKKKSQTSHDTFTSAPTSHTKASAPQWHQTEPKDRARHLEADKDVQTEATETETSGKTSKDKHISRRSVQLYKNTFCGVGVTEGQN